MPHRYDRCPNRGQFELMVFSSLPAICRLQAQFSCHAENQTRSSVCSRVEAEVKYFVATGILGLQHCA